MTTNLLKRKRRTAETSEDDSEAARLEAQEIFRRHFEAQFKPLPVVEKPIVESEEEDDDEEDAEEEWEGISEDENEAKIVKHQDVKTFAMSKEQRKAFMSSKPPSSTLVTTSIRDKVGTKVADDDSSEAANLKHDLALQRLLTESHLLDSENGMELAGQNRHRAMDLRMQALGAKGSLFVDSKMPMNMRKGMIKKRTEREETRRKEARENGIILEKASGGESAGKSGRGKEKSGGEGKRDRGIGGPGVGKFSGGTLTLSKKDIFDIEGSRKSSSGRGGRGGGRGGGKGRGRG